MRIIALGTFIALATTTPLHAQSARTCVAYMEADAAYEARKREATAATRTAGRELKRLLDRTFSKRELFALQMVSRAEQVIILRDMMSRLPDRRRRDLTAAFKKVSRIKNEIMTRARAERRTAYREAYRGPTSDIETVMDRLIERDRLRCRYR